MIVSVYLVPSDSWLAKLKLFSKMILPMLSCLGEHLFKLITQAIGPLFTPTVFSLKIRHSKVRHFQKTS